jgi:hypothetical protein
MRWPNIILVALPLFSWGQGNLVPNPSFEEHSQCPWTVSQHYLVTSWTNTGVVDCSPDYYHACNSGTPSGDPHMGVPANAPGFQYAHSGEAYMGFFAYTGPNEPNGREYVQAALNEPLQAGIRYEVFFHLSLSDLFQYAVGPIGALFTDTMLTRESPFNANVSFDPQIQSPLGYVFQDKNNWVMVCDTFVSRFGGERYISVGNFNSDDDTDTLLVPTGINSRWQSYYYIDDVSVIALDSIPDGVEEYGGLRFSVFPNPATEILHISSKQRLEHVRLLDNSGRAILTEKVTSQRHDVHLHGIPPGLYLLDVTDMDGRRAMQKVVVQ